MAPENQQQLGPLGKVPRLVTPGAKDVALVVAVVVPVDRPVFSIMLPDQPAGQCGLALSDVASKQRGALQIAYLPSRLEGREQRFAGVHIGVLPTVRRKLAPIGARLVGVEA